MEHGKFHVFSFLDTLGAGEVAGLRPQARTPGLQRVVVPGNFRSRPIRVRGARVRQHRAADRGRGGRGGMETRGGGDGGGRARWARCSPSGLSSGWA